VYTLKKEKNMTRFKYLIGCTIGFIFFSFPTHANLCPEVTIAENSVFYVGSRIKHSFFETNSNPNERAARIYERIELARNTRDSVASFLGIIKKTFSFSHIVIAESLGYPKGSFGILSSDKSEFLKMLSQRINSFMDFISDPGTRAETYKHRAINENRNANLRFLEGDFLKELSQRLDKFEVNLWAYADNLDAQTIRQYVELLLFQLSIFDREFEFPVKYTSSQARYYGLINLKDSIEIQIQALKDNKIKDLSDAMAQAEISYLEESLQHLEQIKKSHEMLKTLAKLLRVTARYQKISLESDPGVTSPTGVSIRSEQEIEFKIPEENFLGKGRVTFKGSIRPGEERFKIKIWQQKLTALGYNKTGKDFILVIDLDIFSSGNLMPRDQIEMYEKIFLGPSKPKILNAKFGPGGHDFVFIVEAPVVEGEAPSNYEVTFSTLPYAVSKDANFKIKKL
jgi:hypothetical protein